MSRPTIGVFDQMRQLRDRLISGSQWDRSFDSTFSRTDLRDMLSLPLPPLAKALAPLDDFHRRRRRR